jgi:hypothetical protein
LESCAAASLLLLLLPPCSGLEPRILRPKFQQPLPTMGNRDELGHLLEREGAQVGAELGVMVGG